MKTDPQLDQLIKKLDQQEILTDLELHNVSDEQMDLEQENQVFETNIFERGFDLAQKAGDSEVYFVDSYEVRHYFIGSVADIIKRIETAVDQM